MLVMCCNIEIKKERKHFAIFRKCIAKSKLDIKANIF